MLNIITKNNSVLENKKSNNKLLYTIATLVALTISSGSNKVYARNITKTGSQVRVTKKRTRVVRLLNLPEELKQAQVTKKPIKIYKRFTPEEDKKLIDLVGQYGTKKWALIARNMNRDIKAVQERYFNYLATAINKDPWTPEEDKLIIEKYEELGPRWADISAMLEGRSRNNVRNRWICLEKQKIQELTKPEQREQLVQQPNPDLFWSLTTDDEYEINDFNLNQDQFLKWLNDLD